MDIKLKSVKVNMSFSEETINFMADLFVNGVKVAYCRNDGRGGCTDYSAYPDMKVLLKETEDYCKTLPNIVYGDSSWENSLESQIDEIIDVYINDREVKRFNNKLKRNMLKGLCYGTDTNYSTITWNHYNIEKLLERPDGKLAIKKKIKEITSKGKTILNTNIPAELFQD